MKNKIEVWKDIKGFEGFYQVSSFGKVKSLQRIIKYPKGFRLIKERILKQKHHPDKYLNTVMHKEGLQTNILTHHLVAIYFLEHKPNGYEIVINHKDFNKHNNHIDNLEIITNRQNCSHKNIVSSSKYTGVSWNRFVNKWHAQIKVKGKSMYLGYFVNEIDAHNAYQEALLELKKPNI